MPQHERLVACFSGHVQGVGFRFTTVDVAERYEEISGTVQNLHDGRVELIAEGPPEALTQFLDALTRRMGAYIHNVSARREPATGEYAGFRIIH